MSNEPVAFITGASRGIGQAVARGLAQDGYRLALLSRSKDQLSEFARTLQSEYGTQALTYAVDVADTKSAVDAVVDAVRKLGRLDLLFNNAGMAQLGTLRVSIEDFKKLSAVNLTGAFAMLKAVVPQMLEQGNGTIINVASRAGKTGFDGFGAYCATKFGLVGLSESLYKELCPQGIKVTCLCPSWVDTDMARESGTPLSSEEMIQGSDIVETVRWLGKLSPAACVKEIVIECHKDLE